MKKLFVLSSVLLLLGVAGCVYEEPPGPVPDWLFNEKSYIQGFYELDGIQVRIISGVTVDKTKNTISYDVKEPEVYDVKNGVYINVYIGVEGNGKGRINWNNSNAGYYYELVEKIGDMSYNSKFGSGLRYANADTLQVITITCNKPIDSNHQAGSSLNDIFSIYFEDICAYVKNGYRPVTGPNYYSIISDSESLRTLFGDRLSSVNLVEKPHIGIDIDLILETIPEHTDDYSFTVSVTNKQGKTIEKTTDPVRIKGAD